GGPLSIVTGPDGNLWVTEPTNGGHIARITAPDTTKPTIDVTTPAAGASYVIGDAVNADYACADEQGGSGLASCVGTVPDGDAIDTASLGTHTFEVDAADVEGNTRTVMVSYDVVKPTDSTAPTIAISSPADGATFVVGDTVSADFACADEGGSGLASCDGTVADGDPIDTSSTGTHAFTVDAADAAGNTSSLTVHYTVEEPAPLDTRAPTIELDVPQDGAAFMVGDRPAADYTCGDEGGSGLAACDGTTPNGAVIDTSRPGIFTFTVNASDHAGNHASVTHTYVVFKEWGGKLELPPAMNDVAAGSAVPVWFNLGDVATMTAKASTSPTSTPVDCTSLEPTGPTVPASVSPTGTRSSNGRVMYVWKTDKAWGGTCRTFTLGIAAPTTLYLRFS
ncbi:MAG: PxKF domain-containing protein, partial [Actinomycetota bacterium]